MSSRMGPRSSIIKVLLSPSAGITVDKRGYVYFVDGTTIQMINERGVLTTFIGSSGLMSTQTLSCDSHMDITQVQLEWPTDLAINPTDNSLYILDNNIVLRVSQSLKGFLYIAETDDRKINRIQQVTTNGEISLVAGAPSDCDCKIDPTCDYFSEITGCASVCCHRNTKSRVRLLFPDCISDYKHGYHGLHSRYNSEGQVINITFPTAEVISFQNNMEKSVHVEVENSENFITITNFSSSDTIFTFHQDHALSMYSVNISGSFHVTFSNGMDVTLVTEPNWELGWSTQQ
ncbi:hypothetical protein KOW79_007256 [Hemibagrus wyckioides]|uniref:Teneurin NHL domain-containing protein n=1 Tax=Hemibagrus wyckioides TaxID=337641 RepID=A0A9D3NVC8_9TELE|nr:hypothetical protein KOW79_007256 [Hemibagrus wyckioides]